MAQSLRVVLGVEAPFFSAAEYAQAEARILQLGEVCSWTEGLAQIENTIDRIISRFIANTRKHD